MSRIEVDCLGSMEIPDDCYYGIQTHRMLSVSGCAALPITFYPDILRSMAIIKKAAALANARVGALDFQRAEAIVKACDEVAAGELDDQFPLDMWQGGGYTCFNMNLNEVIANRANEILTGHKGQDAVHPNTHVNMGQSTNDTIPSATHLAALGRIDRIYRELTLLAKSFNRKAEEFRDVVKVGRTCWQDALPLTLGQEFSGYAALCTRLAAKLMKIRPACTEIIMGGSAIGTGLSAASGYFEAFYEEIRTLLGESVRPYENLFDGFQNADTLVELSGLIKMIATSLSKIAKDLRLMSSGPRSGFSEIRLPSLSPGSSIMPGKINPTVPEMVIQIAHQVIGNDVAVSVAYDEGELDLQVWDATLYKCLFESMQLVEKEISIFREHCVEGIAANKDHCLQEAQQSIALCTVIATVFGYPEGVRVAHYCEDKGISVRKAVVEMALLTEAEAQRLIDPMLMTDPKKMAAAVAQFQKEQNRA